MPSGKFTASRIKCLQIVPSVQELMIAIDNYIFIYDIQSGLKKSTVKGMGFIKSFCCSEDGSLLAIILENKISIIQNGSHDSVKKFRLNSQPHNVVFSPNNEFIAFDQDDAIYIVNYTNPTNEKNIRLTKPNTVAVSNLLFSPDNNCLAYVLGNKNIKIFNVRTKKVLSPNFHQAIGQVYGFSFSPDSQWSAFGGTIDIHPEGQGIYIWDIQTRLVKKIISSNQDIHGVNFSPSHNNPQLHSIAYFSGKVSTGADRTGYLKIDTFFTSDKEISEIISLEALLLFWYFKQKDFNPQEFLELFKEIPHKFLEASRELPFLHDKTIEIFGKPYFPPPYLKEEVPVQFLKEKRKAHEKKKGKEKIFKRYKSDETLEQNK